MQETKVEYAKTQESLRFLLALKLKNLRFKKGYSLKHLSTLSGVSSSYLNEIEKGKKLPKMEKLSLLAKSLEVEVDDLVSTKIETKLGPLFNFIESEFFSEFPMEVFGINKYEFYDLMFQHPEKFSSFILALTGISKNFDVKIKNLQVAALRSLQERNKNYFPDLEEEGERFRREYDLMPEQRMSSKILREILEKKFGYLIDENALTENKTLKNIRSAFISGTKKVLLINNNLLPPQKTFVFGKELGHLVLNHVRDDSVDSYNLGNSFKNHLDDFRASYFSGVLIMGKEFLTKKLETLFSKDKFNVDEFIKIMKSSGANSEVFFNRMTQVLPAIFGIDQIFFLRIKNNSTHDKLKKYDITKELHLTKLHSPHGIGLNEHYCRRWITIIALGELEDQLKKGKYLRPIIGVQKSIMFESGEEYFVVTMARPSRLNKEKGTNSCITLGILMDENFKKKVKFWNDINIPKKVVSQTCERCEKMDCDDRAVAPIIPLEKREKEEQKLALLNLRKNYHKLNSSLFPIQ